MSAISRSTQFNKKPIPWMYSTIGSIFAMALMKLSPIHRNLSRLEVKNVRDFFNSDFISPERRKQLDKLSAFLMTYFHAMRRIARLSKPARQDYYALQRQGCFVATELPEMPMDTDSSRTPILVIPGLNTPSVYFREMHTYFTEKGYPIFVMNLPSSGLDDIASSAAALNKEVQRIQDTCNATRINIVGHCLGGLIAHYWLETLDHSYQSKPIQNLVSLGTGFMGAEGVRELKNIWIPRNPGKPIPKVFDELIQANMNLIRHSGEVARHNLLTIWDFMVHFRKGIMDLSADDSSKEKSASVTNHIIEDPDIDHLTLVLNHQVFQKIEAILAANPAASA